MSFANLLDSTVDIKRIDTTSGDGMGGYDDDTYTTIYTNIACRFESRTKKAEIIAYGGSNTFPDYYIYLEYISGITEGDRIFLGSQEFEIKLIEDWSEQNEYLMLSVVEIGRGK